MPVGAGNDRNGQSRHCTLSLFSALIDIAAVSAICEYSWSVELGGESVPELLLLKGALRTFRLQSRGGIGGKCQEHADVVPEDAVHSGSLSHAALNPIAFKSISGNLPNRASNFSLKSLFGEMMSRKYLMIQIL